LLVIIIALIYDRHQTIVVGPSSSSCSCHHGCGRRRNRRNRRNRRHRRRLTTTRPFSFTALILLAIFRFDRIAPLDEGGHSHLSGLLPPPPLPPADDDDEKEEKDGHNADILAQPASASFRATVCLALVLPAGRRKQLPSRYHFDRSIVRRHHGPWTTDSNKNCRANNIGNFSNGGPTAMRSLANVAATTFFPVLERFCPFRRISNGLRRSDPLTRRRASQAIWAASKELLAEWAKKTQE
jgi:hypothetical protein